jgi:hypothetical protein
MQQRHLPDKSGVQMHSQISYNGVNHPYPWPRLNYNEHLSPRIVRGLAVTFRYGNDDAASHSGLYQLDRRPQHTIQQLMVPAAQKRENPYG